MDVRARCPRCRQAQSGCWCEAVPRLPDGGSVVLLQHPREARNSVGTARMAHLSLPGSQLLVGVSFGADPAFRARLAAAGDGSVVLYPSPDARPIEELAARPGPRTLWVIDGTWSQARKVYKANPALAGLPTYRLSPRAPSTYVIRREPAPDCLSTVEAVAAALDVLHPGVAHASMLAPLRALVARQLAHAEGEGRSPRRRARPRSERPRSRVPAPLRGLGPRALLVHAEGNGWPGHPRPRPPGELVQWLAVRPSTGERFAAVVATPRVVGETMRANLELGEDVLAEAVDVDALRAAWRAFVRPGDAWCAWGMVPSTLAAAAGLEVPAVVDVRSICRDRLRARPGKIEDAIVLARIMPGAAQAVGRGGRRLAALEALFASLVDDA